MSTRPLPAPPDPDEWLQAQPDYTGPRMVPARPDAPVGVAPSKPPADALPDPDEWLKQQPDYVPLPTAKEKEKPAGPNLSPQASDDDIIKSFGYDPATIKKSPYYQKAVQAFGSGFAIPGLQATDPNRTDLAAKLARSPLGGLGMGAFDVLSGAVQGAQHLRGWLGVDPEDTPYVDLLTRYGHENYKQNILQNKPASGMAEAARLAGNVVATSPLPGSTLAAGERLLPALAGGAVLGAETGALQPVVTPGDYAKEKAIQTGGGAALGVAGTGVARGLTAAAGRTLDAIVTRLPEDAAARLRGVLQGRMQGSWGDLSDVQQAATGGSAGAQRVLDLLNNAGTEPEAITQAAINLQNYRTAQQATSLYGRVGQLADPLGNVPVPNGTKAIQSALDDLQEAKVQNKPLQNYLRGIQESFEGKPIEQAPTNLVDPSGRLATSAPQVEPPDNRYSLVHGTVSQLGDHIQMQKTGENALLGNKDTGLLQQIKNAFQQDLDHFTATQSPELNQAANAANDYYRDYRVPFKDQNVARAGTTNEQDTIFNTFIKKGRGDLAQKFYNSLDAKGRGAVQYDMVDKAMQAATDPVTGFDPGKFARGLNDSQQAAGVFFQGDDKAKLDGLQNLMIHAAQVNRVPFGSIGVGGEVLGGVAHALGFPGAHYIAGAGVTSQMAKALLLSDAGRKLLYSASSATPLTPEMGAIFGRLRSIVPAAARGAAAAPSVVNPRPWAPGFAQGGSVSPEPVNEIDRNREGAPPKDGFEAGRFTHQLRDASLAHLVAPSEVKYAGGGPLQDLERRAFDREVVLSDLRSRPERPVRGMRFADGGDVENDRPIQLGSQPGQFQPQIRLGSQAGQLGQPVAPPSARYTHAVTGETEPEPVPEQVGPSAKDLDIGLRQAKVNALNMLFKPAESIYGGTTASGRPLSEVATEGVGPDPRDVAVRQGVANRALQFVGGLPVNIPRYALMTAATGGEGLVPSLLGGFAADTMAASGRDASPTEATAQGLEGAALGAGMHYGMQGLGEAAGRVGAALPDKEALDAAAQAARERLIQRGTFSGATAHAGFDPQDIKDLGILTGAQLGSGAYTVGEAATARANQVRSLLQDMREKQLDPQTQDAFAQARQASPELNAVGDYMMPLEVQKTLASPGNVEAMSRLLRVLPDEHQMSALAKAGAPKLGWYRGSSQAISDVFGEDAPRFAQLLAAMSPQTSVESNLTNALNVWKNWTAAGRPTDENAIKAIMGQSVQGGKGEGSLLGAWVPNSLRALQAENPMSVTLSGPKVDSFYHNLRDDVFRVTNDAWMANAFGVAQDYFAGSGSPAQLARGDPGMGPGYVATSARLRQGAAQAGMFPSQGQETIWSTAMQLYELAKKNGISPQEVLDRGLLTPQAVRGTPDFSTLLKDPAYARILEQAGYGPQLEKLQPFQFPVQSSNLTAAEQQQLSKSADVLGQLQELRGRESGSRVFAVPKPEQPWPTTAFSHEQLEAVPGRRTGMFPGMIQEPMGIRKAYTSRALGAFEDPQGRDVLQTAAGLPTLQARGMIGSYKPRGEPLQINPGRSLPAEVPISWGYGPHQEGELPQASLDPDVQRNLQGVAAIHAAMLGQEGVPYNVLVPQEGRPNLRLPMQEGATEAAMRTASQRYPKLPFADTGLDMHVLNFGDALTDRVRQNIEKVFGSGKSVDADNLGDYLDFTKDWAARKGSGAVTRKLLDYYDNMTPAAQAGVDQAVRQPAGDLEALYTRTGVRRGQPVREDVMNLLRTLRDQGLSGVRPALQSGKFLPGLVGAVAGSALLGQRARQGQPQ